MISTLMFMFHLSCWCSFIHSLPPSLAPRFWQVFAQKLHARGFPYVSILEGGMEGIVEHLKKDGR